MYLVDMERMDRRKTPDSITGEDDELEGWERQE